MKKFISSIVLSFFAVLAFAQSNPNRLLVVEKNQQFKGFLVERIDSMYFDRIEGPVNVAVTIHEFNNDDPENPVITASFKKTKDCHTFRFIILPKVQSDAYADDATVAAFFANNPTELYFDDFDHGQISGFGALTPGGEYTILAMGYDKFGIACESSKAEFKVPAQKPEGNPSVTWTLDNATQYELTLTITPNADCDHFYTCLFKAGEAQEQFKTWGPMFGFATLEDMVKGFSGEPYYIEKTQTWKQLAPGTDYEIYIIPCDASDIIGESVVANVSTKKMGGEGVAEMTITIGEFGHETDQDGVVHYYQQVIYTPNDQTAAHRDMIIMKSALLDGTWTEEKVVEYMKNEKNPDYPAGMEDPYWDIFGVDDVKWNVEPNTEYCAYSMGKNANGEWGPLTKKEFTTGAPVNGKAKTMINNVIAQRKDFKSVKNVNGKPMMKKQVRLIK